MGLFDFLQRKRTPPAPRPQAAGPRARAPKAEDEGPSPHYVFAHYALRQFALENPLRFLAVVASPDAEAFFEAVLQDVCEHCHCQPPFAASSIQVHTVRIQNSPCAVIELPEPGGMTEAFMVALVVLIDIESGEPPNPEDVEARYFTLEQGFTLSNEPRTVLAEWDSQRHSNYGDGPEPTVEAFVRALGGQL